MMEPPGEQDWLQEQRRKRLNRVSIGNIVTGNDVVEGQDLPEDSAELEQLSPYTNWVEEGLNRAHYGVNKVDWFGRVVHYFSKNPDAFIEDFKTEYKSDWPQGTPGAPAGNILDFALEALSFWLTIEKLHQVLSDHPGAQYVIKNCVVDLQDRTESDIQNGKVRVTELVQDGQMIPKTGTDVDPLKQIGTSSLNMHRLMRFGQLKVRWTTDISQHLSLIEGDRVVMVFCIPSLITVQDRMTKTSAIAAFRHFIPDQYVKEVRRSYWLLFGGKRQGRRSFRTALKSDPDNRLTQPDDVLCSLSTMKGELTTVWAKESFPHLWPRIWKLKNHLDTSEPEGWWGWILYNKTEPYVWVPILVSGLVLLLTLASTGATIAQTWKTFNPGGSPGPAPTTTVPTATPTPRLI